MVRTTPLLPLCVLLLATNILPVQGQADPADLAPGKGCMDPFECCRFNIGTPEFDQCCFKHGVCPVCDDLSKGCCYNDEVHAYGAVVEEFPDSCSRLVCAAVLPPAPPCMLATLVNVRTQPCTAECRECEGPALCVDHTGLVRTEGEEWFPNLCQKCKCKSGEVVCTLSLGQCPPPPPGPCEEVPGDCCPIYHNCGCLEDGVWWKDGDTVPSDDMCKSRTCVNGAIVEIVAVCLPLPPPFPHCVLQPQPGQCCPGWLCDYCNVSGEIREVGTSWNSTDCFLYTCLSQGLVHIAQIPCRLPPDPTCRPKSGACCEWECGDPTSSTTTTTTTTTSTTTSKPAFCIHHGVFHKDGDRWEGSPGMCTRYICKEGDVYMYISKDC